MTELKHAFDSITSRSQGRLPVPLQESEVMNLQTRLQQVALHLIDGKTCTTRTWKKKMANAAGCSYQNIRQAANGEQLTMDPELLRRIAVWAGVNERFMVHGLGPMLSSPGSSTSQNYEPPIHGDPSRTVSEPTATYLQAPLRIDSPQVTKQRRAPLVEWARLGVELQVDNIEADAEVHLPVSGGVSTFAKWATAPGACPRFGIRAGYRLLFDHVIPEQCIDGDVYLFEGVSGALFLGEFRHLTSGHYEMIPDSGPPMDTHRHRIKVIAELLGIYKK